MQCRDLSSTPGFPFPTNLRTPLCAKTRIQHTHTHTHTISHAILYVLHSLKKNQVVIRRTSGPLSLTWLCVHQPTVVVHSRKAQAKRCVVSEKPERTSGRPRAVVVLFFIHAKLKQKCEALNPSLREAGSNQRPSPCRCCFVLHPRKAQAKM